MSWDPEDESFWGWSNAQQGRVTMEHEFGHVFGLNHSEGFDIMRASTPQPIAGGNTSEPYPDDANGVRATYGGSSTNLFASAQKFSGGAIQASDAPNTINVCVGSQISVTVTIGNNGTLSTSNVGFRVFLNNGPNSYSGGWNMFTGTATNPAGSYLTQTLSMTIPNVPKGFYWILWQIDTGNSVSEYNESDNTVHSAMNVQVGC